MGHAAAVDVVTVRNANLMTLYRYSPTSDLRSSFVPGGSAQVGTVYVHAYGQLHVYNLSK